MKALEGWDLLGWRDRLREHSFEIGRSRLWFELDRLDLVGLGHLIIQEVDRRSLRLAGLKGRLEAQLQLGFGSTIELLVDGGIVAIENNIGAGGVAVAFEEEFGVFRDAKEKSKLDESQ